ncbi:hypothetical protein COLO4_01853 [Corchorus olitorius]|uniref:Uncharacterized protein n=1 Tax=Corchorus olitorius TaxID=93759 RepID=A0A1R3L1Y0_9ROSI|nr:hypothetical protein COLO4_01853 [Corchorus olitorius]
MVGIGVLGAQQIGQVESRIVLLQAGGRATRGIGRQALHAVFPGVEVRAAGRRGEGHGLALGIRSTGIEIGVGRGIGHHVSQANALGGEGLLALAEHGVALHHLATAGMSGDHHLLQIGQQPTLRQAGEQGIEHREAAQRLRTQGGLAAHPGIALPAQQGVRQPMTLDAAMHDDQGAADLRMGPVPVGGQLQRGLRLADWHAVADDTGDPLMGRRQGGAPGQGQAQRKQATHRGSPARGQSALAAKVSQLSTLPLSKPVRNHLTRCAELPWVKESGTTRPWDWRCRRSSPMALAAFSAFSRSPGSSQFSRFWASLAQTPA